MNERDEHYFQQLIMRRLAELDDEDRLGKKGQSVVTLDQQSVGRLSRMDAMQSQAMAKATQYRRDSERVGLVVALARIKQGEFGFCEDCGEAIGRKRLELNPTVTKCINCARG